MRSGSRFMIRSAARTASTFEGGMLALKISARARCLRYSMVSSSAAMNPPSEASDLLKVPMMM